MSEKERKPVVYLLTCIPTGKQYVGIAKCDAAKRFRKHCTEAAKGSGLFLHRAIRKYGSDNFKLTVICQVDTWNAAKIAECRYIVDYGTFNPAGFNMTRGGEGTIDYRHTNAAKEAMSRGHTGKIISTESRMRMSMARKGIPKPDGFGARVSAAQKGRKRLLSEAAIEKLTICATAIFNRPDVKANIIAANRRRKGVPQKPEIVAARIPLIKAAMTVASVRAKIVASNQRRGCSEVTRQRMSVSLRKALAKPEVKAKIAAANAARIWTPEARANMRAAMKNISKSAEHREKLRQAWVRRRQQTCDIDAIAVSGT